STTATGCWAAAPSSGPREAPSAMTHPSDVVLAIVAVLLGCLAASVATFAGVRTGNWLAFVCAAGCAAFVAGVVGQRTFPSAAAAAKPGSGAASTSVPGPWDAGVSLPALPIRLTPVSVGGVLAAAIGLSLVLLFERVPGAPRIAKPALRPLDDDDA